MFKGHPKGLIAAALSNMGERFGYYIMNAVLLLFLCSKFGIPDEVAAIIYGVFYFAIYVMALPGGIIADKLQNYKGTIIVGLITMAAGYLVLSFPIQVDLGSKTLVLVITCLALLVIAAGNGLFKGNLQAIVGQMYDDMEAEAAKQGPEALAKAKSKRDPGFQIFYVFINIGGVLAPFVAPYLRQWWLGQNGMTYNANLPKLCHEFINNNGVIADPTRMDNLNTLMASSNSHFDAVAASADPNLMLEACKGYLEVFNTGVHYSFIASMVAMLISLSIFMAFRRQFPAPIKKVAAQVAEYTAEEKAAMAKEIKQRMAGLYAVLGICVFFWMSFHQNGQSLSIFARDFVHTESVAPEVWQFLNPALVILLTPVIMWIFGTSWGKTVSTPRKIVLGMIFAACAYLFLTVFSSMMGYPSGNEFNDYAEAQRNVMKADAWVLIVTYFFLTVAELFISPLGLSFVSKIAPKHIQGICQGLWLTATAIGNLLIFLGPVLFNSLPKLWMTWTVFLAICLIAAGVMFGMLKWLERITAEGQK